MNFFRKLSMTNQLLVPIALVSTTVLVVLGLISSRQIYSEARNYAVANSLETSRRYSEEIRAFINKPFAQVEILGRSLSTQVSNQTQNRHRTYLDLKDLLSSDPGYLATWSAWEPDAFDGRDQEFKNKELHEQTGRFYPWWIRKGDTLIYKTLLNEETPDLGDWYFNPLNSKKSMLIEPYTDTIDGKKITMTSAVYTVVIGNKALGIVGVDLNLKDITELVGKIKPYAESVSYLVSDGDNFVAHPNEDLLNKPVNFDDSIKQIITSHEQKTVELYDSELKEDVLYTITPIPVWNLEQTWSLVVKTPMSAILVRSQKSSFAADPRFYRGTGGALVDRDRCSTHFL